MSIDLVIQKAIRSRLISTSAVTELVPESAILDRNTTPAPRPSIVIGDVQIVDPGDSIKRTRSRVTHTLHIWKTEPSREGIKAIMGAIRTSVRADRLDLGAGLRCVDWRVSSTRALSDPDGVSSHGIMALDILADEVAP